MRFMTASSVTPHARTPDERLAAEIARLLRPQRFPSRRDLELAGVAGEGAGAYAFYDAFWLPGRVLALGAAQVRRGGTAGALRASALHRLLRAALALQVEPAETLDLAESAYAAEFPGDDFDLAFATLDPATGRFAGFGRGHYCLSVGATASEGEGMLPEGSVLWLAVGARTLGAVAAEAPEFGMDDLAARLREASGPGAALVGVTLRSLKRKGAHDFAIPNDLAAIAGLVSDIEATLSREEVPDMVGAALGLALDELLTNTVSYGYPDNGWHEILVDLEVTPGCVDLTVRDDGRAFDPLQSPEPDLSGEIEDREVGGLGIHFVRTLADELSYARERGWNVLRLRKRFAPEAALDSSGG